MIRLDPQLVAAVLFAEKLLSISMLSTFLQKRSDSYYAFTQRYKDDIYVLTKFRITPKN